MTNKQRKFFKHAKAASEMSSFPRVHIGAIVTCGNKVVGVGFNSRKSSPIQKKYNKYRNFDCSATNTEPLHLTHAEVAALGQLKYMDIDVSKCEVWTYRENLNHELSLSRPCAACMNYLKDLGIKKIHYTTDGGYADEEIMIKES